VVEDSKRGRKPSGWKDGGGSFWIKSSKYGQKYMCKLCGREALGYSGGDNARMHWPSCSKRAAPKSDPVESAPTPAPSKEPS
jgi:hypothetical protein